MIMCAEVTGVDNGRLIVTDSSSQQEVVVNTRCLDFNKGEKVKICYNGIMTMSLPPQISAYSIIRMPGNHAGTYLKRYEEILKTMIKDMCCAGLTDSISHNFIVQMIPHHRAAIEMSENILEYTNNSELIEIADGIIEEQTKSIQNMQDVLSSCSEAVNCSCDVRSYQTSVKNITSAMFSQMQNAYSDCRINCDFIREMIPHHRGAVMMSKNAFKYDICPDLKPILDAIIESQEKGIRQMRCLSDKLKCR